MLNIKFILLIFTVVIFTCSCGSDSKSNNNTTTSESTANNSVDTEEKQTSASEKVIETVNTKPFQEKEMIYAWVDKLNIRDTPNLKGKTIATVTNKDALAFTGEQSEKTEEIVLRGVAYDEPWLKIITPDKTEGWVFGGAVVRLNQVRGNDPLTEEKFDFPYFGAFDLSTWKKLGTKKEGEEVDIVVTTYQKGNQILEVSHAERGEFYYAHDYKLMDANKKILKTRNFNFVADTELIITETVKDFVAKKEYTRTQQLKIHFYDSNDRPKMVNGEWSEKALEVTNSSQVATTAALTKARLQPFKFVDCGKLVEKDFSCSCSFSTSDFYKGPTIFVSDWDKSACVNVDGELNALYPDWEERDYKAELKKLAESKTWIMVKNSGVLYFGKPLSDYKYDDATEFLTDVILASGKNIKVIPIQNTAEGMVIREITDSADDAIAKAKEYQSKGGDDPLSIVKMDNRKYDVFVRYRKITQFEGEANRFEGSITLLQNRGKEILETKVIKGNCGC